MTVNIENLKRMQADEMRYLLLDIILIYKNIEYPEDLQSDLAKILYESNLISK